MATMEDLSKQRIDFSEGPDGSVTATLTVTLQDGTIHRFTETSTPEEIDHLASVYAVAEAREMKISGEASEEEIAGIFDSIAKGFKSVVNVVKKVVTSKVFRTAGKGLAMAAPALGPFAPAAMAVSAGMATASKLGAAATAAEGGAKRVARKLVRKAARSASRRTRGKRRPFSRLMKFANSRRKAAAKVIARSRKMRGRRKGKKRRTKRRAKAPNVTRAAQLGRLRSNRRGSVSPRQLAKAAKSGRVYWFKA